MEDYTIEDILSDVQAWFYRYCGNDGYDSYYDRRNDLEAMSNKGNDMMVDNCIENISDYYGINIEEYRNEIENKLAELAYNEI